MSSEFPDHIRIAIESCITKAGFTDAMQNSDRLQLCQILSSKDANYLVNFVTSEDKDRIKFGIALILLVATQAQSPQLDYRTLMLTILKVLPSLRPWSLTRGNIQSYIEKHMLSWYNLLSHSLSSLQQLSTNTNQHFHLNSERDLFTWFPTESGRPIPTPSMLRRSLLLLKPKHHSLTAEQCAEVLEDACIYDIDVGYHIVYAKDLPPFIDKLKNTLKWRLKLDSKRDIIVLKTSYFTALSRSIQRDNHSTAPLKTMLHDAQLLRLLAAYSSEQQLSAIHPDDAVSTRFWCTVITGARITDTRPASLVKDAQIHGVHYDRQELNKVTQLCIACVTRAYGERLIGMDPTVFFCLLLSPSIYCTVDTRNQSTTSRSNAQSTQQSQQRAVASTSTTRKPANERYQSSRNQPQHQQPYWKKQQRQRTQFTHHNQWNRKQQHPHTKQNRKQQQNVQQQRQQEQQQQEQQSETEIWWTVEPIQQPTQPIQTADDEWEF